jgi:hypothetical protein
MDHLSNLANALQGVEGSKDGNVSLTHRFYGDIVEITYTSVVHFSEEQSLRLQTSREIDRSMQVINGSMKVVKENYKNISGGKNLTLKEQGTNDNIEIISATAHSPRKIAYYRRQVRFSHS